jgi:aspartate/methionine/tyrosine aminotransferase
VEFRRISNLPPYVFTIIDGLKVAARRAGEDVIDLGFGNPDLPSPAISVDKLAEAARNPRNHRYSASRGIPKLREAVAGRYRRRFGVELDPELEVIATIGAKEGFSHLMWVLLQPGDAAVVQALAKLKSYLDYGVFQPIQIAATVTLNEDPEQPERVQRIYQSRRDTLCGGLRRIGWEVVPPMGTMFVWAPIPEPYREMGSVEFASFLVKEAKVATSPGVGFGPGGDGHVRFALIENEQRIQQGVRNLRRALTKLG